MTSNARPVVNGAAMHESPLPDELGRLRELTIRDELTGLYKRKYFQRTGKGGSPDRG